MMVRDDPSLLDRLFRDMAQAEEHYRPTNYWQVYEHMLSPTIQQEGITRFRSSSNPVFSSFGVTCIPDVLVDDFSETAFGHLSGARRALFRFLQRTGLYPKLVSAQRDAHRTTLTAFWNACFHLALLGEDGDKLLKISDSGMGAPRDLFTPSGYTGIQYTLSFLRYFREYQWVRGQAGFEALRSVLEVGSGYGGQAEVLLKVFPKLRYVLCDIPPQIYVAEQYLKAVFPEEVTGYGDTADLRVIDLDTTKRITILATWQLPRVIGRNDLLWSCASFQEMEPKVVENYAKLLQPLITRYVYLKQNPTGKQVALMAGQVGVFKPTTVEDYVRSFCDFQLFRREDCVHIATANPHGDPFINTTEYDHMLFRRPSA